MRQITEQVAEIDAIFDQLLAYMGDDWANTNVFAQKHSGGSTCGLSTYDANGNGYTYNRIDAGPKVGVTPAGATIPAGGTVQFTAEVKDSNGVVIPGAVAVWSLYGGGGTIDQTGLYTAPATAGPPETVTAKYGGSSTAVTVVITA